MGYVDDAFSKLKSNLEITDTESRQASSRHQAIRDHVRSYWTLDDDFLTGSYRRETKTKRLKDVDVFVVIDADGDQGHYRDESPGNVLAALLTVIEKKWEDAHIDGMAVVIPYGKDDDVMSIEVVPAFDRAGGGYHIPDPQAGAWIATNPKKHHEASTKKNEECGGKYVPLVKMVKAVNREMGEPVSPSFLLEVMALEIVTAPVGRYGDEIISFLATAADRIHEPWPDPARIGPDVNTQMSPAERMTAAQRLRDAQEIAENAVDLQDEGKERAAVDEWRRIFGSRMPRP